MFADSEGEETNKIIDKHLPLHLIRLFAHTFLSFLPHRRLPRSRQTNPSDGWERLTARCCVTVIEKEKTHNTRRSVDDREKEEKKFQIFHPSEEQANSHQNESTREKFAFIADYFVYHQRLWVKFTIWAAAAAPERPAPVLLLYRIRTRPSLSSDLLTLFTVMPWFPRTSSGPLVLPPRQPKSKAQGCVKRTASAEKNTTRAVYFCH